MSTDSDCLKGHRIREIGTAEVHSTYVRTIERNSRIKYHGDGVNSPVFIVITDQGAVGWGLNATGQKHTPKLEGVCITDVFNPGLGITTDEALALDFALHDLAGVIMNKPVYRILGDHGIAAVRCYDGAIYMDDLLPEENPRGLDVILENCRKDYAIGYRDFKIKIGRGYQWMGRDDGLERDIDVTRAVRESFPDSAILVDANDAYSLEEAIRFVEGTADCGLYWIEEPFRENRESLRELKRVLSKLCPETLIADGESNPDTGLLVELAREGLVDVMLMDMGRYGFTPWRRIMPQLKKLGVRASPHVWGDPLKCAYVSHLAAGLGNICTVEGVPATTAGDVMKQYRFEEGVLRIPEKEPGFGMSPGGVTWRS